MLMMLCGYPSCGVVCVCVEAVDIGSEVVASIPGWKTLSSTVSSCVVRVRLSCVPWGWVLWRGGEKVSCVSSTWWSFVQSIVERCWENRRGIGRECKVSGFDVEVVDCAF